MTRQKLLMTTMLSVGFCLGGLAPAFAADDTITTNTVKTSDAPISVEAAASPQIAAQSFVAHVNYARVALAMKNGEIAQKHITQATNMISLIENSSVEFRRVVHVVAGRVYYEYDLKHKYNYFPIEAGRVEIKEMDDGPIWAKNSLAVNDAEIVTLSLDLTNNKARDFLTEASTDITEGKFMEAEAKLGELTDAVVSVEDKVSVPVDKAHDNIGIAQHFIKGKNYNGARFALGHADDALDEMLKNDIYKVHRAEIIEMSKEIKEMRELITKKDPTMMQTSGKKLDKWMDELKTWAKK